MLIAAIWLTGCTAKKGHPDWNVNDQEYLETRGFNVLVFHNSYPVGDQGGIEFIHHGERTASNGFINIDLPGNERFPLPETAERTVDRDKKEIRASVKTIHSGSGLKETRYIWHWTLTSLFPMSGRAGLPSIFSCFL